eukprot:3891464-Rhodomonas_salina.1
MRGKWRDSEGGKRRQKQESESESGERERTIGKKGARGGREGADLEGDGEVAEALSKDPDDGVEEPADDDDAGELAVDRRRLPALGLGRLSPRLAQAAHSESEKALVRISATRVLFSPISSLLCPSSEQCIFVVPYQLCPSSASPASQTRAWRVIAIHGQGGAEGGEKVENEDGEEEET